MVLVMMHEDILWKSIITSVIMLMPEYFLIE